MIKQALDCCGFQGGESFALASILNGSIVPSVFTDIERAEEWLAAQGGRNCYLTGNPVKPGTTGRPSAKDILCRRVLLVDVDPDGADTSAPMEIAREIHEAYGGTLIDSGRGAQVWLRVDDTVDCRAFLHGIREHHGRAGGKIDSTHDAPRCMRLPGTINLKTGRLASIVSCAGNAPWTRDTVAALGLSVPSPEAVVASTWVRGEPNLSLVRGEAQALWDAPVPKGKRSDRDWQFVLALLDIGASEEDACKLLWALPEGKASSDGRGQRYWGSVLKTARTRQVEIKTELSQLHTELSAQAANDSDELYLDSWLDKIIRVKSFGELAWRRLRRVFSGIGGLSVRELEKAIKARTRRVRVSRGFDDRVRFGKAQGAEVGWWLLVDNSWVSVKSGTARIRLGDDAAVAMQQAVQGAYELTYVPFAPENPAPRVWNHGAGFACDPIQGRHETWDQLLRVLGSGLDGAVTESGWCNRAGVRSGADYLLFWVAAALQKPEAKGAYLFFTGEKGSGKSMFHEALRYLVDGRGLVDASAALDNPQGFNEELAGAVFAYVDEFKFPAKRGSKQHNRLKLYVMADFLSSHGKNKTPVMVKNYLHLIQCTNDASDAPIFGDDDRITAIGVKRASGKDVIEKREMQSRLRREAPAFLWTALNLKLPPPGRRSLVPPIGSALKERLADNNASDLERWLKRFPGHISLSVTELCEKFTDSLSATQAGFWSNRRLRKELPEIYWEHEQVMTWIRDKREEKYRPRDFPARFGGTEKVGRILTSLSEFDNLTKSRDGSGATYTYLREQPLLGKDL